MNSNTVLGILGSGQLARMTALAAYELGIKVHIYCDSNETSPAEMVATKTVKGTLKDRERILNFSSECDFITLENEFIDQEILNSIEEKYPKKLYPSAKTFSLIGNKLIEKETFQKAGINVVPFLKIENRNDLHDFIEQFGYPVVLKSSKGGYDGYGNFTIRNESQIDEAIIRLNGDLIVEAFIPFIKELAIIVAKNDHGMIFYPIAQTVQENHICHFVEVPAKIEKEVEEKIIKFATVAMDAIDARGIFAFEFFLTIENEVYLNESAPRPHNSGHYSIDACITSQFQNHVRSVLNLPLGNANMISNYAIMLNLLGTQNQIAELKPINDFLSLPNSNLHLYGKTHSKLGRKMGHFTVLGKDREKIYNALINLKEKYTL